MVFHSMVFHGMAYYSMAYYSMVSYSIKLRILHSTDRVVQVTTRGYAKSGGRFADHMKTLRYWQTPATGGWRAANLNPEQVHNKD